MSKAFAIAFAATVVLIAGLVWAGFRKTAGNHLNPAGSIGKIRTVATSDATTFAIIDFNVENDSNRDMVVRSLTSEVKTAEGDTLAGNTIAAADIAAAFKAFPLLGERYNPVLKERDVIPAHQRVDRMVAININAPAAKVDARRGITLRIEDITGPIVELKK